MGAAASGPRGQLTSAHDAIPRLTKHTPFFGCLAQCSDFDAAHVAAASRTIISHFARLSIKRSALPLQLGRRDMLFVESGELQLVSNDRSTAALNNRKASNHPQPVLKTVGENEVVGLMELVQGVEESVDALGHYPTELIAHRDASCVLLTHKKFEELRTKHAPKCGIVRLFCANLENMTRVSTVEWLKRVSFFTSAGVDQVQLLYLSKIAHFKNYHSGEVVLKQGDTADRFYVVLHGSLEVSCKPDMRKTNHANINEEGKKGRGVGALAAGDFFGESALLVETGCPISASASVTTKTQTLLLYFDPVEFRAASFFMPQVSAAIYAAMKRRYSAQLEAMELPIFAHLKKEELQLFAQSFHVEMFEAGAELFAEGSSGDDFYILLHGAVRLRSVAGADHTFQRKGDYFGELALIRSEPRRGTIAAVEPTAVALVCGHKFRALFLQSPTAAAEFEIRALREQASAAALLHHPNTSASLRAALDANLASENHVCWDAVQAYRGQWYELEGAATFDAAQALRLEATKLYDTFVNRDAADGSMTVNVSDRIAKALAKALHKDLAYSEAKLDRTLFDGAERAPDHQRQTLTLRYP